MVEIHGETTETMASEISRNVKSTCDSFSRDKVFSERKSIVGCHIFIVTYYCGFGPVRTETSKISRQACPPAVAAVGTCVFHFQRQSERYPRAKRGYLSLCALPQAPALKFGFGNAVGSMAMPKIKGKHLFCFRLLT